MINDDPMYVRQLEMARDSAEIEIKALEDEIRRLHEIVEDLQNDLNPTHMGEPLINEDAKPVGYGLFVEGKCLQIGQHPSSGHVGGKAYKSQPLYLQSAPSQSDALIVAEAKNLFAQVGRHNTCIAYCRLENAIKLAKEAKP